MHVHHFGIEVENLEESIRFYQKCLNLEIDCRFSFIGEEIVFLSSNEVTFELVSSPRKEKNSHICFQVQNLEDMMNKMQPSPIMDGPFTLENGWRIVFYEGPDKEIIEFLQVESDI